MPKDRNRAAALAYFSKLDRFSKQSIYGVLEGDFGRDCMFAGGQVVDGVTVRPTYMAFPFVVTPGASNIFGTMHGGMTATLVDIVTSCHLAEYLTPSVLAHVTSTLSTQYVSAGKQGAPLVAVSTVNKAGKRLASTTLTIIEEPTESEMDVFMREIGTSTFCPEIFQLEQFLASRTRVVATGAHTKAILPIDLAAKMK